MNEQKSKSELVADKAYWLVRLGVLAAAVMMFLPAMNPSRVCEQVLFSGVVLLITLVVLM